MEIFNWLLIMIVVHIIYTVKTWDSKMENWQSEKKNRLFYLFADSLIWSFIMMAPTIVCSCFNWFVFLGNLVLFFLVEYIRLNTTKNTLIIVQVIRLLQIAITFWLNFFIIYEP